MSHEIQENTIIANSMLEQEKQYWSTRLAGSPPCTGIRRSREPAADETPAGRENYLFVLDERISLEIGRLANQSEYGIFMILLSGLYYILYRYSENTDLTIGVPVFRQESMEELLNYVLPLRIRINSRMSFREFLKTIRDALTEANEHMNYPFERMHELTAACAGRTDNGLFNVFARMNTIHDSSGEFDPPCDFLFAFDHTGSRIGGNFNYYSAFLDEKTAAGVLAHCLNYFAAVSADRDILLCDIEILPPDEKKKLLEEFSGQGQAYNTDMPDENPKFYVLNEAGILQPAGITGDLYIAGNSVRQEYLKQAAPDREKFLSNPHLPEMVLLKTGDRARWLHDGTLVHLGKKEQQVMINGNRIDPGEIELLLRQHPAVREAVVTGKKDEQQNESLCAYVVPEQNGVTDGLQEFLAGRLPPYMLPSSVTVLARFPLTPAGAIDREALQQQRGQTESGAEAANAMEEELVKIWQAVLGKETVGVNDNFFSAGGDSLKAMRIVSRLQKLGYELQTNALYTATLKEIAAALNRAESRAPGRIGEPDRVEAMIEEETGIAARLTECRVNNRLCKVLYVQHHEEEQIRERLLLLLHDRCERSIGPHYLIFTRENIRALAEGREMGRDKSFKKMFQGGHSVKNTLRSVMDELDEQENRFVADIMHGPVIREFPCSAIQQGTADMSGHMIGMIYPFDVFADEKIILKALGKIIAGQELLRSVLGRNGDGLFWKEFAPADDITIPFVDLSCYDPEAREEIIRQVVEQKYHKLYFGYETPLYRFIVIRESLRDYKLIAPVDHMIFDGMSAEIIIRNLHALIAGQDQAKGRRTYRDYVHQTVGGPVNISPAELMSAFSAEEYRVYADRMEEQILKRHDNKTYRLPLSVNLKEQQLPEEKAGELSLYFTALLSGWVFHLDKIPLKLFYYGRSYLGQDYFDTVGYFTDFLPVLVTVEENDRAAIAGQVQQAVRLAKEHNINFAALHFAKERQQEWEKVLACFKPRQLPETDQMLLYNFQGNRSHFAEVKAYYRMGDALLEKYRLEGASFSIVSYYTEEELCLDMLANFRIDREELERKFKEALQALQQEKTDRTEQRPAGKPENRLLSLIRR